MDTARYIRITNLCMLFFRAEGIAFSLYDKHDTCHQPCRLCFHPDQGRLADRYRPCL